MHQVSVITTTYNGLPFLKEAVDSVLAQTAVSLEYIVVDDGSTDETAAFLKSIKDPRLIVHQPGRIGRANALNLALQSATAPYIANLDADDSMLPGRLAQQANYLAAHEQIGLVGSAAIWKTAKDSQTRVFPEDDAILRRRLFTGYPFVHSAVMYRQTAVQQAGGFDQSLPCALDYDLCCRIAIKYRLANLPKPLVVRRVHDKNFFMQQISPRQFWQALWQIKWRYWQASGRPLGVLPRLIVTTLSGGFLKWLGR